MTALASDIQRFLSHTPEAANDDVRNDRGWSVGEDSVKSLRARFTALETTHIQLLKRNEKLMGNKARSTNDPFPNELKEVLDDILA